jgi:uncharacterized protein RhaS with RHS repeats
MYSSRSFFNFAVLLSLLLAGPISAYQPGRFSPLDQAVLRGGGGPSALEARDANGKLIESARFEYDSKGRLIREHYTGADGATTGSTEYIREGDRLKEEIRRDRENKVLYRTLFFHDGSLISRMDVHDAAGALELRRTYTYQKGLLLGGEEIVGQNKDRFRTAYDQKGNLIALTFLQQDGKPYGEIAYRYDAAGKLTERERSQPERRELCRYEHAGGRIVKYSYFGRSGDQWILQKTLVLRF